VIEESAEKKAIKETAATLVWLRLYPDRKDYQA
jgi:hypothetical protein